MVLGFMNDKLCYDNLQRENLFDSKEELNDMKLLGMIVVKEVEKGLNEER